MKSVSRQFSIFVVGGCVSALVDVGVTILFLNSGAAAMAAVSLGFLSGLVVNLLFHARITFRTAITRRTVLRYCLIVALNYFLTIAIVYLAHDVLGGSVILGKIISLPVVAAHGFAWSRWWIFEGTRLSGQADGI